MHYTAVGATLAVSHSDGRGHNPPCPSQGCRCHRTQVTFFSWFPFLTACGPRLSLLLSTSACSCLHSIRLRGSGEDPHPWPPTAGVVWCSSPGAAHLPTTSTCKTGAGDELQVPEPCPRCPSACPVCLPELQRMSLSVWMASRALQCVKKPLFLKSFFSDGGQALLEAKLKACQTGSKMQTPGWVIFVSLSNPRVWTAGARASKSWSWHNHEIYF